jgi:lipopolysaccharide export system permease protein
LRVSHEKVKKVMSLSIISKYIVREIIKYTGMILTAVVGIYVLVDFFQRIDDFIEAELPISKALVYFLYKTPFIIAQIMPVAILLSVIVTLGLMARKNEIIALKSCGISVYYLLKPIAFVGLISTIVLFLFSEIVVPITSAKENQIWLREVRHEAAVISKEKDIWLKDNRMILHINYFNRADRSVSGITIYRFDEKFKMIHRIDARRGEYRNGKWELSGIMEQVFRKDTGKYDVLFHDHRVEPLKLLPDNLTHVVKKSKEMNFMELREYVHRVESEGYDATHYRVDLYAKIAFPCICIILCLVGTGIAVRDKMREGLPLGIALGIFIAFMYWIFYSFCVSLGYGEMLPPAIAVWIANLVFISIGMYMVLSAE